MAKTKQIFGQGIFNLAMKATVYGQFVAGEDKDKIKVDNFFCFIGRGDSMISAFRRGPATSIWSKMVEKELNLPSIFRKLHPSEYNH